MVVSGHGKKYDLLPLVLWFCGGMVRSTICSLFFLWLCRGHGKKYDLLPLVFVVLWGHGKKNDLLPLVVVVVSGHGKKYDLLPLFLRFCGGMARSTICCL